ncbi:MAG: Gfo/Idh/MocA family oxidoreductase [Polyangiaceae bacterium]|jgi:predicted dehydrogenase|nr:Gfo/Idh/MocA family oxidoreductase [Polyangiaceae bacterium]
MHERVRIAQIGCGAWGRNLLREVVAHPLADATLVIDLEPSARALAHALAPDARVCASVDALDMADVDAVIVASPGPCHAVHVRAALARKLHVLVEKPMTTSTAEARALTREAERLRVVAMVGHLLQHHQAVLALLRYVRAGRLGSPVRFRSHRLCTAGSRDVDGSLIWSLAPHDIAVLRALDRSPVVHARADVQQSPPIAQLEVLLASGLRADITLSRAHRAKVRRLEVACERGVVVFDDLLAAGKVKVFCGDRVVVLPYAERPEPLCAEVDAFVRCIRDGQRPRISFSDGLEVVSVLEAAQFSGSVKSVGPPLLAAR